MFLFADAHDSLVNHLVQFVDGQIGKGFAGLTDGLIELIGDLSQCFAAEVPI